jgi:hypothetical protein
VPTIRKILGHVADYDFILVSTGRDFERLLTQIPSSRN